MNAVNPQASAGQGRLAQVIATRGGLAAPEAPFVIEHREALIYMLCEAAELEHGIMCQYLFAAFSMKQSTGEGLTDDELAAVTRWRKRITHVATQEMLHLALVQNLLSAIGAAPHMSRPNLPAPAGHYPAGVQLALIPFGEKALQHFMFLERPETYDLDDPLVGSAVDRSVPQMSEQDIVPAPQDFATVGHLYRSIEAGIAHLADKYGESWLFVGPPRAQATQQHFGWPELTAVTDAASAQRAIDTILEQGEGPRGHWQNAHFGQFVEILDEFQQMSAANPGFDPVRPVIAANVRPCAPPVRVPLITDPLTAQITDLFNVGYEIMLQIFERFFAHTEETDPQLKVLADTTVALMFQVIEPLANLITTLPAGPEYGDRNAAPSFELFYESDYLMPHREAAWKLLAERLDQAAALGAEIQAGAGPGVAARLAPVAGALTAMAAALAVHLPASSPQARHALAASDRAPEKIDAALARARELADPLDAATGDLAALFRAAYAVTVRGRDSADLVVRLVDSVLRPLSDYLKQKLPYGGGGTTSPAAIDPGDTDALWNVTRTATHLRTTLAKSGDCPPELIEATAALQALAIETVSGSETVSGTVSGAGAAQRLAELRELSAGLPPAILVAMNGPYLVTNVERVVNHLGEELTVPPQLALCRCGESARKPFCDGSHASNGFTAAKDPDRVPDQRDTYAGQQVTIFDNRGLCQHSGLCTDRLATVFRVSAEPFVAPSGGRMDEIIRVVRACPSGALGFALDGAEARSQTDWGNTREPAIEISKDGPYRITGGIELTEADGTPVTRNEGASLEHGALCRCGHSKNKPFCSGAHWYANFTDPQPSADPTLFEWAGGLPALTRMTKLLYEKLIPADPQLAAAFASIPPGYAEREAQRIAEIFGGPAAPARDDQRVTLTEDQRPRWTVLAGQAATESGLPTDAPFRAALASYLEWDSRETMAAAQTRWDWTPAGPPQASQEAPELQDGKDEQPMEDVPVPGPDEPVSFATHIRPLFREKDRNSMSRAFDLWSVDDVRTHGPAILARLRDGSMPCDGAWPADRVAIFQRWTESGEQE